MSDITNNHFLDIIDNLEPLIDTPLIFNNNVDTSNIKNLLLIDSIVSESQLFFDSSNQNTFPIIYSNNSNRADFIQLLENKFFNGLERIAFVFHDNIKDGKAFLNQELFFLENVSSYSANTQLLIDIIKKYGVKNIDFLACNSLNYSNWVNFYDLLAKETGVIVGASNDKTGNLKHGGNWVMENTNENVVSTYFNSNINSYASTLASTITSNGGTIYIYQVLNNIFYNINGSGDTQITSWPVTIVNSNPVAGNILTVSIVTPLTISNASVVTGTNGYFICGSQYITYDGAGKTITIDNVTNYLGLIQNGTISLSGYSNITVKNINNAISGSSRLASSGGWICQRYFGKGANNILLDNCTNSGAVNGSLSGGIGGESVAINGTIIISNCSNSGLISVGRGGICGRFLGQSGNTTILNCSNTGNISVNYAGGICGGFLGYINGKVSISNCTNSGVISGQNAGGITGSQAGQDNGNVSISNCTNSGVISGQNAGGICGGIVGNTNGNVSITNCYNTGNISGISAGGICGASLGYNNGKVSITNCYNTGNISGIGAGGITGANSGESNGSVTITNCYNTGIISGNYSGGITGPNSGQSNGSVTITNCYNTGIISGNYSGGIGGDWFGYNTNNLCSIINCYNTGNITGTNCGGITADSVGYNDNATYVPKILIQNCYSLGNIATTCGGICGGTDGSVYTNIPVVNITNCYTSYNSIVDANSQYISINLPTAVRNAIILTNVYSSLISSWSDREANSSLSGSVSIYRNTRLYKYYKNFGAIWYSNQNNTPFYLTSYLNTVPRRKRINM